MEEQKNQVRKFSKKEKLGILGEAKLHGIKVTLAKYDVYPATYYYWKKQYEVDGTKGLDRNISKATRIRWDQILKDLQVSHIHTFQPE